ncbi:MAG: diguanylate cyclase [Bacilli bacterium]
MNVKKEMPKLLISLAVVPLVLISVITFISISYSAFNTNKRYLKDLALAVSKQINNYYTEQINTIIYSKEIESYKQLLDISNKQNIVDNHLYTDVSRLLELSNKTSIYMNRSAIVDLNGKVICSSDKDYEGTNVKLEKYFNFSEKYNWQLNKKKNNAKEIVVSAPILDQFNKPIGLIVNFFNMDYVISSIRNYKLGISGYLYVIDNDGEIISHYYKDYVGEINKTPHNKQLINLLNNVKQNKLEKKAGFISYDKENTSILASYHTVYHNNWVVVATINEKEVFAEAIRVSMLILMLTTIVYAISTHISIKTVKKLITPLVDLSNNIKKIASGNLTYRTRYNNDDEFKQLYDDINIMAENLNKSQKDLEYHAFVDVLTNIPNRQAIYRVMKQRFVKGEKQAAIMLDLDGFKKINDTYGHDVGDIVLIKTAEILNKYQSKNILFSRLGGDEFYGFIDIYASKKEVLDMLCNIYNDINNMIIIENSDAKVSASIGIAFSNNEDIYSKLMKKADTAMYKAKSNKGKVNYIVYTKKLDSIEKP